MSQPFVNRPLPVSFRPTTLSDYVSSEKFKSSLEAQFKSRMPHFILVSGQTGSGKTTLARIIAKDYVENSLVIEINASDKNGVDDMRSIIADSAFKPVGYSSKVYILDEAHQLTTQAQNALLKITEESPEHVYFIFCTNNESKILQSLKRRAYFIAIGGLKRTEIHDLINKVVEDIKEKGPLVRALPPGAALVEALLEHSITSPGLILQALEKYINGDSIENSIYANGSVASLEIKKICTFASEGKWTKLCPILSQLRKEDIPMVRHCLLNHFKSILLCETADHIRIAKSIKVISEECYDLPVFLANVCLACSSCSLM